MAGSNQRISKGVPETSSSFPPPFFRECPFGIQQKFSPFHFATDRMAHRKSESTQSMVLAAKVIPGRVMFRASPQKHRESAWSRRNEDISVRRALRTLLLQNVSLPIKCICSPYIFYLAPTNRFEDGTANIAPVILTLCRGFMRPEPFTRLCFATKTIGRLPERV